MIQNTPSENISPIAKKHRDGRRQGALSVISVILVILMVIFELGAVYFLSQKLGMTWDREKTSQDFSLRIDSLRRMLQMIKTENDNQRMERDWILREINSLSAILQRYPESLDMKDYQRMLKMSERFTRLFNFTLRQNIYMMQMNELDFTQADQHLKEAVKGVETR